MVRSHRRTQENSIYLKKVHKYKNIILIKLSDNKIQVIFGEGDGFVWQSNKNQLSYFCDVAVVEKDVEIDPLLLMGLEKGNIEKIKKIQ